MKNLLMLMMALCLMVACSTNEEIVEPDFDLAKAVVEVNQEQAPQELGGSRSTNNASNVVLVEFALGNNQTAGTLFYPNQAAKTWLRYDIYGNVIQTFTETHRDQWSVYLNDNGIRWKLDLHTRKVYVTELFVNNAPLFNIVRTEHI